MTAPSQILYALRKPGAETYDTVSDDHFDAMKDAEQGDILDVYHILLAPDDPPEIERVEVEPITW